jgi:Holliday junction DNA helicase RuvA
MFWYLRGTILWLEWATLTLEIDGTGLGMELLCSPSVLSEYLPESKVSLWVHHHITDVSEVLFWFSSPEEREIFRTLLRVNGVGGKTALNILGLGREAIIRAIELEDDKLLSSVPGIGKKTAQKIIVDLKWSIDFSKKQKVSAADNRHDTTLITSLVQMWYDKSRVEDVIGSIDSKLPLEIRTVEAIKQLSKSV